MTDKFSSKKDKEIVLRFSDKSNVALEKRLLESPNREQLRFEIKAAWFEETGLELLPLDLDALTRYYWMLREKIRSEKDMFAEVGASQEDEDRNESRLLEEE
ncbi:MAG: hypothetical protein ABH950_07640 [Candidatus Altiarchaeota archaeon]